MKLINNITLLVLAIMLGGCGENGSTKPAVQDDHAGHDHSTHEESGTNSKIDTQADSHADDHGHDHGDAPVDDQHDEPDAEHNDVVNLSAAQLRDSGVVIAPLNSGDIATHIMLPAEVGLNLDSVVHVTPRVSGVVTSVHGFTGNEVKERQLLGVLESSELGEAKIFYLQTIQAKVIADAQLTRQATISQNTATLLALLEKNPTPTELREQAGDLRIGVDKGRLLSAYAQMKSSSANYDREKELDSKGLATQADLLAAQEVFYSAQAQYAAAYEDIEFSYRLALQESEQNAMIASMGVENAERRLHLLGMTQAEVDRVTTEPDTNIARYELRAPGDGQIIAKHLSPGEKVGTDEPVYTIANLDTVWLNIAIYSQYAGAIKQGQRVTVRVGDRVGNGVVDYISAVITESSRTIHARVVIENPNRDWKPGEFVTARIETQKSFAKRVVPIAAIQSYEGHDVVFVQDDGIEPRRVTIGRKNDVSVELLNEDIALGTPIVVVNSFLIKAELGKGSAGHEH